MQESDPVYCLQDPVSRIRYPATSPQSEIQDGGSGVRDPASCITMIAENLRAHARAWTRYLPRPVTRVHTKIHYIYIYTVQANQK